MSIRKILQSMPPEDGPSYPHIYLSIKTLLTFPYLQNHGGVSQKDGIPASQSQWWRHLFLNHQQYSQSVRHRRGGGLLTVFYINEADCRCVQPSKSSLSGSNISFTFTAFACVACGSAVTSWPCFVQPSPRGAPSRVAAPLHRCNKRRKSTSCHLL